MRYFPLVEMTVVNDRVLDWMYLGALQYAEHRDAFVGLDLWGTFEEFVTSPLVVSEKNDIEFQTEKSYNFFYILYKINKKNERYNLINVSNLIFSNSYVSRW